MEITFKTSPHKAVSFVESAVKKALDACGYLIAEVKYDGVRGNIVVDNTSDCLWLSRVSKTIPALEHLNGFDSRWTKVLKDDRWIFPDGFMLDGELMVKGVDFNTGSGLLRTKWLKKDNAPYHSVEVTPDMLKPRKVGVAKRVRTEFKLDTKHLKVVLYAAMPYHDMVDGKEYPVMNLLMRMHMEAVLPVLREHFPEIDWELSESHEVTDMVELSALYEKARSEGHEGLIVKDPFGYYQRGKKSGFWKLKPEEEADGVITEPVWGTPGLANEGKVIGFEVLLETGRVVNATNITKALMEEFTANVQSNPEYYKGWAVQITYMEATPDGSLRHPTFDKFRGTEDSPKEKM